MKKYRYCLIGAALAATLGVAAGEPGLEQLKSAGQRSAALPGAGRSHVAVKRDAADQVRLPVRRAAGVPAPKVTLGALKVYDESADFKPGFYTIEARADGQVKLVKETSMAEGVRGAAKSGNAMYCISTEDNGQRAYFFTLNTDTWTSTGTKTEISIDDVPSDMTIDPVTGKIYGAVYYEDPQDYNYGYLGFGEFNRSLYEFNITKVLERDIYAIAADDKGIVHLMFGTRTGWINPTTLEWDSGLYGVHNTYYPALYNTMTYDPSSGLLYAIVNDEVYQLGVKSYKTYLVSIDPVSYEYTSIFEFPTMQGYAGLFVMETPLDKEAPKGVENVSVSFPTLQSLEGTVSFTAPVKTVGNSDIVEDISVILEIGGEEFVVSGLTPGQEVTTEPYTFPPGAQTLKLTTANSVDRGETVSYQLFAGEDVPAAVGALTLDLDGEHPVVSWTAPSSGLNDGPLDLENLRYTVVRNPGEVTVASNMADCRFEDTTYEPDGQAISYTVTPRSSAGEGASATTSKGIAGLEWTLPVNETFDTQDAFDLWSIYNSNGGSTWQYDASGHTAQYKYDENYLSGDDWLVSPAIRLESGRTYTLGYDYRGLYSNYDESMEVTLSSTRTPGSQVRVLASHDAIKARKERNVLTFSVESDGKYYLSFHATSAPMKYILEVDNVTIEELSGEVPQGVSDLQVTPGERGALTASVSFTLPTLDIAGNPLTLPVDAQVYRTGQTAPVYSASEQGAGSRCEFSDAVSENGLYTYTVKVSTAAGNGEQTSATAFVGVDVPDAVQNLRIAENSEGLPVLTWEAPTQGRNGGWFDASLLRYDVYQYFGELELIAEKTASLTATDTRIGVPQGQQIFVSYVVMPFAGEKAGRAIESPYLLVGQPYTAPLTEGFANADMSFYPWISVTDEPLNSAWTLEATGQHPLCGDYDNNGGLATFHSYGEQKAGVGSWFESPKMDISKLARPALTFALYHSEAAGDETMQAFMALPGQDYRPVSQVISRNNGTTGWQLYTVEVPAEFAGASSVRVAFKGVTAGVADIHLDAVTLGELPLAIAIESIAAPGRVAAGEPVTYDVKVTNRTSTASEPSRLLVSVDGAESLQSEVPAIEAGRSVVIPVQLTIESTGRKSVTFALQGDSEQHSVTVESVEAVMPTISGLEAEAAEQGIRLIWDDVTASGPVTDTFESYEDFAIDGIGEWRMIDRDFDVTYYIDPSSLIPGAPSSYPHCTEPKAWQVMNAAELGINEWPQGTPKSGDKMLMAMANRTYVNDDWAVSPRLNGEAQTISFYAKAFTAEQTPAERLEVLYSTTDTEPAHFTAISPAPYLEIGDEWREYRFELPAGARYFALHCVSDDAFALFVDDVRFADCTVPALTLLRYELSRDGEEPWQISGTSYTDSEADASRDHVYTLRAIFDKGATPEVTVNFRGTSSAAAVAGGLPVVSTKGLEVTISGLAGGERVTLATPAGLTVASQTAVGTSLQLSAPSPGLYLITIGEHTCKLMLQ